ASRMWQRIHRAATGGDAYGNLAESSRILSAVRRVTAANERAWHDYRPGMNPGRITLMRAHISEPLIAEFCDVDATNGWARYTQGGVEVIDLPCNHLELFKGEALQFLADRMREILTRQSSAPSQSRLVPVAEACAST